MSEKEVKELIEAVETELGVSHAIAFVRGNVVCGEKCIRIFVDDIESFRNMLVAIVKQGITTGGLPVVVVEHEGMDVVEFSIVDYIDGLVVTYTIRRK
jgi:hypothetical protein